MREGRSRASCYAFSTREFFQGKKFTKGSQNFLPTTRRENHANFADHCRESIPARLSMKNNDGCLKSMNARPPRADTVAARSRMFSKATYLVPHQISMVRHAHHQMI